jgi:DNA-binding Lrp family transcriptional regulator
MNIVNHQKRHLFDINAANYLGRQKLSVSCGEMSRMPMAFVLINTEIGSESEVLEELKKIEAVKEAYMVYGVYDVVAKVGANTMEKLKEIVTWNVRRLDKVRSTLTMIVIEGQK